jgi:2-polyprenyl-3-methyl-5-hydroxy-6-metoxy-1,4-benzoquinol methylase
MITHDKSNASARGDLRTDSDERFTSFYAAASESTGALNRFNAIHDIVMQALGYERSHGPLDVADIGCNAGTQCRIWAAEGHRVFGLDINLSLLALARQRAEKQGLSIRFVVGSATDIPLPENAVDVCIAPELLEHVVDWRSCLREFARIVRPGGVLYLTTTNKLCPRQQEFDLPFYSWYPAFLKHHYERLSVTSRPELVAHATYPAVNWFTYFGLRRQLAGMGFSCMDRFDSMNVKGNTGKMLVRALIQRVPGARIIAHIFSPYTRVVAVKRAP